MNIIFYNYFHNGDIHYTRQFIKDIISKTNFDNYFFAHVNKTGLLKDIKIEEMDFNLLGDHNVLNGLDNFTNENGDICINTWIGRFARYGINIDSNYRLYEEVYKFLNISINEKNTYIQTINFDFINKDKINSFFINKNKRILFCNGKICSGQSTTESFDPIIIRLSETFPNFDFILTDDINRLNKSNIFYTNDIIKMDNNDLNEISYLSTFCDVIIGKESGPFAFCTIKDNLMNENKTFINFCDRNDWVWFPYGNCKYKWSNNYNSMYDIIKKNIE